MKHLIVLLLALMVAVTGYGESNSDRNSKLKESAEPKITEEAGRSVRDFDMLKGNGITEIYGFKLGDIIDTGGVFLFAPKKKMQFFTEFIVEATLAGKQVHTIYAFGSHKNYTSAKAEFDALLKALTKEYGKPVHTENTTALFTIEKLQQRVFISLNKKTNSLCLQMADENLRAIAGREKRESAQ